MKIPDYVQNILLKLEQNKYEAYIVGGCVRDLLMERSPNDWDITTNARPEQILEVFPEGKYENIFGTVIIPVKDAEGNTLDVIEVTTYRSEQGYSDRRHPDEILFEDRLDKDLERRDFTVNAMGMKLENTDSLCGSGPEFGADRLANPQITNYQLVDLFGGQKDIKKRIIRAVGEPEERFREDALRMMRAVRFACQLGFEIEEKTGRAIIKLAGSLKFISAERIRDELIKILSSGMPYEGIMLLHKFKLLNYILPELENGVGIKQDRHHIYDVFKHNTLSLKYCPNPDWRVRLAALLHDVAKPQTKKIINNIGTFYNHEIVGAKVAKKIAVRLKLSNEDMEKVVNLVRHHMFYYNVGEVTAASVRRLIVKVGKENLPDLIDMRIADRLGSGTPKAKPYKLRHLEYMFEKVQNDPVSVKMLKMNGNDLMEKLAIEPGPRIGALLDVLLSEVIENPESNNMEYLSQRSYELKDMDLEELRRIAKEKIEEKKIEDDKELKSQYYV